MRLLFTFIIIGTSLATGYGQSATDYFNKGLSQSDSGNHENAILYFNRADELSPNESAIYFQRGYSKHMLQDYSGAMVDYNKAINIYLTTTNTTAWKAAEYYNNRAGVKADLQDYRGAVADYTKAIELDPNYSDAYKNRGISKERMQDYRGAIADYSMSIELDPNNSSVYTSRGACKTKLKDHRGAIADYNRAIELDPNNAESLYNRGFTKILYLNQKDSGCYDLSKAGELGVGQAYDLIQEYCN